MVKNFLAVACTGMMSLGDNQAASFPPRLQSQVFMFQKEGGKKKELFISMRSEPAWIFQPSHPVEQEGAHLVGITSKMTSTRRISKKEKKETICLIAGLLCKQNSHQNSSSPIIWVSSLSLCANTEGKKGGKKGGGVGGEGGEAAGPFPAPTEFLPRSAASLALVPNKLWQVGSLGKRAAVAGWAAGRELRDFTFNQKRTKPAKQKKKNK